MWSSRSTYPLPNPPPQPCPPVPFVHAQRPSISELGSTNDAKEDGTITVSWVRSFAFYHSA